MNKFRRFLFRISAKTCLNIIILLVNSPNRQSQRAPPPDPPFRFNDKRMCKNPTPIETIWLMQILGNFVAKSNLHYIFLVLPPCLSKNRFRASVGTIFIDATNKISILKNWNIARNLMCFIMNVIIAKQKVSANLIYLSFSKFSYRQNILWSWNLSPNMTKST